MIPEASAGCVCQFSIAITLEARKPRRSWTIVSSVGDSTPVKHMALNLGAPGDRKDALGKVWLAYLRPVPGRETGLDLTLQLKEQFVKGGEFTSRAASAALESADIPWLYSSWAEGLTQMTLPLLGREDAPAKYSVRLHFAEIDEAKGGTRVFDVKLQGRVVLKDFDIATAAGGPGKAVIREIEDIEVTDDLVLQLVPRTGQPLLSAIEVRKTR